MPDNGSGSGGNGAATVDGGGDVVMEAVGVGEIGVGEGGQPRVRWGRKRRGGEGGGESSTIFKALFIGGCTFYFISWLVVHR